MNIIDRFNLYVMPEPNTGCWFWIRPLRNGYGLFSVGKKTVSAHRFSYEYYVGSIGNYDVCHSCDVPSCVNPHHLFLGTHKDNMNDRDAKGRVSRGGVHYASNLNELDITIIRQACDAGFSNAAIGRYFNVRRNVIRDIRIKKTWKHV